MKTIQLLTAAISIVCIGTSLPAELLPAPPLLLNCGPQTDEAAHLLAEALEQRQIDADPLLYLPDVPYRVASGYGHRRGEGYQPWHGGCRPTMGPLWESDLFASGRIDPGNYTFHIPLGIYHVTVGICDGEVHVRGQRVFDVIANGTPIAHNVDPIALAGYKEPLLLSARVQVGEERKLTVSLEPRSDRPPIVSAIWITPVRSATSESAIPPAPAPPQNLRAVGSYDANLVSWHRPKDYSINHFAVRRRVTGSPDFEVITPTPIYCHRWVDRDVEPGTSYEYQVASRDSQGRTGWSPTTVSAVPRSPAESSLPRYTIHLTPDAERRMLWNVREDQVEQARFEFDDKSYPIQIRIRGASTRHAGKKSYRIRFTQDSPFPRKVIYLKAEAMDHTMQQEKLSCDLFRAAGAIVSEADFVNLFINDRYEGVYVDIEPVRSPFKEANHLDADGILIRASTFQHLRGLDEVGELRGDRGSLDPLREFLQQVNRTPRGAFEQFVRQRTDWPRVRDYLALIVLTHRTEIEANDYFFYCDPQTERWSLIPWDHNNGNFHVQSYGNEIGEPFIHVFPQTIQQLGWRPNYWYVLPSRIFQTPQLRREYLDRLEELTNTWLVSGRLDTMIDANFDRLRSEYPLDPHRWPFAESDPFIRSAEDLKRFVRRHRERILDQIQAERNPASAAVVINEFAFGQEHDWIELHNRGNRVQSLRSLYLVTKNELGNWQLSLRSQPDLQPDEYRVLQIPYRPMSRPRFTDDEARERWELAMRDRDEEGVFPGYAPEGGFLGLVQQQTPRFGEREDDADGDRDRQRLLDFYFYGPGSPDKSYGRIGSGFEFQTPSPGRMNVL